MTNTTRSTLRAQAYVEKTAPLIIRMMDEYLSNSQIAEALNQQQHLTPMGKKWNISSIGSFIHKNGIKPTALSETEVA